MSTSGQFYVPEEDVLRSLGDVLKKEGISPKKQKDILDLMVEAVKKVRSISEGPAERKGRFKNPPEYLSTQDAADMLGVSRTYLVGLLDSGKLSFHKVGNRRRVRLVDVEQYRNRRHIAAKEALRELTQEAQDLGLGY